MLISNSGDVTHADSAGLTPLMYAGMAGRCRAIGRLSSLIVRYVVKFLIISASSEIVVFLFTPCFRKKTSTHITGYKLRNSCLILIIFDTKIPHII